MEGKKSFLLYIDLIHTVNKLPNDKAGELFKHILEYVNDKNPETDDIIIQIAFEPIKQQLKRDLKQWESICERNKINGSKGGRPPNPTKPNKPIGLSGNPDKPKKPDTDKDSDNDKDSVKENKQIPTYQEFKDYSLENSKDIDLEKLELKYKSWVANNWNDGNNKPIKNWKSKILNTIPFLKLEKSKLADDTDY